METFQVSEDLVFVENAVYLPTLQTLVISDLQLGLEQQLRKGANIIYEQATQMLGLLEVLITQTQAKRLVINGDLKHEFGKITFSERRDIITILKKIKDRVEVIVVKGNHDTVTKPLTDEVGVPLVDYWTEGGFYVLHGHELPKESFKAAHTVIIGHTHPAIRIDDGVRSERYKCFLVGEYKQKRLVVLPSFSTIVEGTDVLKVAANSPLIQDESSMVYVIADEIRPFGKISQLRRILG